ncbi:transcriptional regulator, TetR family [Aquimarina amphilecti]|uniref:Transcriptional regulator, TetR family n=1 Tax=Aquimarina amphilecti TaxID=1038014 RepID=A0A1H7GUY3_AQUAM|nr:TetR/AcrR family transcriptional regulator [Aquimarina amphilecti]SEK41297.1 transcriptional regulator, TetR family [Aquimarina amphilecti]
MPKVETFDRIDVLQKATEIFHKKGYNGTSMQDLVDVTHLNRSSIYNSFGSKLGIFMQVLSFYQNAGNKKMGTEIVKTHNASDTLQSIFEWYLNDIIKDEDRKGCLIVNCKSEMSNQEPLINSFMVQNQEQMIALLEDVVHNGQMEKVFNEKQTAGQYALYLYSSIQGLRMTGILNTNENELRNLIKTVLTVLY